MSTIKSSTTTTTAYSVSADTTGTLVIQTGSTPTTAVTVGTDQSVTFAQAANLPNTFGFKNRILNGHMQIAQRATSATITAASTIAAGYSTVDRFYVYCTGANVTAAQVAGSGATKNRLQITGAASVTAVGIGQRIESLNSYDMAGSTATLSLDISNSLLTTVTWTAYYANTADTFGTLASPTRTQISTGTFTVTSTLTNYSTQISIPAAATTGIEIVLTVGAQTSGTWVVGNIQLEKGSIATSFDYRPYGTELALCQRYCYVIQANPAGGYQPFGVGQCSSTTAALICIPFPVTVRTPPNAISVSAGSDFGCWNAATSSVAATAVSFNTSTFNAAVIQPSGMSGLVAGNATTLLSQNTANSKIIFNGSEL